MDIIALSDDLRRKIWRVIRELEDRKIFIHSELLPVHLRGRTIQLPLIITLTVLNALVARGSMLLYGGYGGGKTTLVKVLGRLLTSLSISDIEASIVRAHPQLTEEKIVGRLHVGKLLRDGEEKVVWRNFIESFWKIIDEINRLSPSAQDAIFSILSEGIAKYFDGVYVTREYVFYATINPRDIGSYPLGLPLLDRFGMAVPISMPMYDEMVDITEFPDDKLHEFDDSMIPTILSKDELIVIWNLASRINLEDDAKLFISALIREFSACIRTPKELGTFIESAESICRGCHFNTETSICNKTYTPLSVRAGKDLVRYSKALAWLLGTNSVSPNIVFAIAPFVIWHRVHLSPRFVEKFHDNKFIAVKHLVDIAFRDFIKRMPLYRGFLKLEHGNLDLHLVDELKKSSASDLIVATDLYPIASQIINSNYLEIVKDLVNAIKLNDDKKINLILLRANDELPSNLRGRLVRLFETLVKKNRRIFLMALDDLPRLRNELISIIPKLNEVINKTPVKPRVEKIKFNSTYISMHFTGSSKGAPLIIEVYGLGKTKEISDKLSKILNEVHPSADRGDKKNSV